MRHRCRNTMSQELMNDMALHFLQKKEYMKLIGSISLIHMRFALTGSEPVAPLKSASGHSGAARNNRTIPASFGMK